MKKKIISLLLAGLTAVSVVAVDVISIKGNENTIVAYAATQKTGVVTADTLNVRSLPNTSGKILGTLKKWDKRYYIRN